MTKDTQSRGQITAYEDIEQALHKPKNLNQSQC